MEQKITKTLFPNIKHIVLVASGKGGVGKSTIATGLAMSLAANGNAVGLLDADIYGPSIPLLFNLQNHKPVGEIVNGRNMIAPSIRFGIKLMSIGFFFDAQQAVAWRGPRASSALSQLLTDTNWGDLDYLIIDTPPGTGDSHITLLQNFAPSCVIIVTTPQQLALADVKKSIDLYRDKSIGIPILSIVENMAWFTPDKHPDEQYFLFGRGGGQMLAMQFNVNTLIQIPITESLCLQCDSGALSEFLNNPSIKPCFNTLSQILTVKYPSN